MSRPWAGMSSSRGSQGVPSDRRCWVGDSRLLFSFLSACLTPSGVLSGLRWWSPRPSLPRLWSLAHRSYLLLFYTHAIKFRWIMNSHLRVEWTQLLFIFLSSWSNFFEGSTIILRPREFPERSRTFFQANLCAPPRRTCICRISCFCFRRCRGPGGHQLAHLYIRDYDVFEASP